MQYLHTLQCFIDILIVGDILLDAFLFPTMLTKCIRDTSSLTIQSSRHLVYHILYCSYITILEEIFRFFSVLLNAIRMHLPLPPSFESPTQKPIVVDKLTWKVFLVATLENAEFSGHLYYAFINVYTENWYTFSILQERAAIVHRSLLRWTLMMCGSECVQCVFLPS